MLLVVTVDVDVGGGGGGGGGGTGVGGADDGEIDEVGIPVDSFGTSLSDKLFRLRVDVVEESGIGSVECSESDRERDCLSALVVDCFRKEERSIISGDTNGGSDNDR